MSVGKLESLPAELCLKLFEYLSSFDLLRAFADLNNARLQQLAFSRPFALDASIIGYAEMKQIFATPRLLVQLRSITRNSSLTADAFYAYWTQMIAPAYIKPHIDRLLVTNVNHHPYTLVPALLQQLSFESNLHYIHLRFPYLTVSYTMVLQQLVRTATSFQTMILEIDEGT